MLLVVLFGNVWAALNPWRAAADAVAWLSGRAGLEWEPPLDYPRRLGRWPAVVLLLAFATLELAYVEAGSPRALALAIYLYSAVTWLAMLLFGREAWLANGEAFSVYFAFLAKLAPLSVHDRRLVLRLPLLAASIRDPRPGTLPFVAIMLGSVAFDGFSRTSWWVDWRYELVSGLAPRTADVVSTLFNLAGLVGVVVLVGLAYTLAVRAAAALSGERRDLAGEFLASLLPIALAYTVAHYFSLLVYQGQALVPLASDPFGRGWDLFGTAGPPDPPSLSANAIWYVQVGALIVGHVAGLVLAHDRAVALLRSPRLATATQYPLLLLMVLYTVCGLWLLSRG